MHVLTDSTASITKYQSECHRLMLFQNVMNFLQNIFFLCGNLYTECYCICRTLNIALGSQSMGQCLFQITEQMKIICLHAQFPCSFHDLAIKSKICMGGIALMVISPKNWEFCPSLCPHCGLFNHIGSLLMILSQHIGRVKS